MRGNAGTYVLVILLVLMLLGVFSFGDVLGFIFYIFMGILVLGIILILIFRFRINRVRRQMYEQQAGNPAGSNPNARRGTRERRPEGEVTVNRTSSSTTKVVSNDVGSYVEYEEYTEETSSEDE